MMSQRMEFISFSRAREKKIAFGTRGMNLMCKQMRQPLKLSFDNWITKDVIIILLFHKKLEFYEVK